MAEATKALEAVMPASDSSRPSTMLGHPLSPRTSGVSDTSVWKSYVLPWKSCVVIALWHLHFLTLWPQAARLDYDIPGMSARPRVNSSRVVRKAIHLAFE